MNLFDILKLIDERFSKNGFKGVIQIIVTLIAFFIVTSPVFLLLFLFERHLFIDYNITLIYTIIIGSSCLLFTFIYILSLVFSARKLQSVIEKNNSITKKEQSEVLLKINILISLIIMLFLSIFIFIRYLLVETPSLSPNFTRILCEVSGLLVIYLLISFIYNWIFFKKS